MFLFETRRWQQTLARLFALGIIATVAAHPVHGQAVPQVSQAIDTRVVVPLKGSVHPLVSNGAVDLGAVPDSTQTGRITLLLKRPPAQEQALQQFLSEAHSKSSPMYHKWLTPGQFGQQFGVTDSDMSAVKSWLESQGLKVENVSSGKSVIQFSGTAGQVGAAFRTSLHAYSVKGETHHANSTELQVPAALQPVIAAVGPLNDFHPKPLSHLLGTAQFNPKNHQLTPQFTLSVANYDLGLAPEDLATQYDIKPVYAQGLNGAGQTIGIINESNIDLSLVAAYRKLFNLDSNPSNPNLPQIVIDGNDPGVNGAEGEAFLDVEVSGAIAPQATVKLYIANGTDYTDGLSLAVTRAIEEDAASVLSLSFGGCEALNAPFGDAFYNASWEQAAAQGQTVMVSTGDSDSAGCDGAGATYAEFGRQVNGLASTPWNIAVGGTDFYYPGGLSSVFNFWSQTNDSQNGSLLQSLPEQPWNNSRYDRNLAPYSQVVGGGGGQSACAIPGSGSDPLTGITVGTGSSAIVFDCAQYAGYPKPAWQSGPGVPADGVRDLPDVALFAANGFNGSSYVVCENPGDCSSDAPGTTQVQVSQIGGTSASAPLFAGIMALINQRYGSQGQANTVLYPLAQRVPAAFHDITVGSNNAPCSPTTNLDLECVPDASGGTYSIGGWNATPGYDLASGLGSVDVNQLIANWNTVSFKDTRTVLSASSTALVHGQTVTLNTSVTGTGGTPTGNIALVTNLPQYASTGLGILPLNATGQGTITTNKLPGGTYSLIAKYAGDAQFGGSQSAPISLEISPEKSVIRPTTHAYAISYPGGAGTLTDLGPIANGATYPYGTAFFVDLQITGAKEPAGTVGTPATGSTTLIDRGVPISTNSIDVTGSSSYSNILLPVGQHTFQYAYSGDSSYRPTSQTSPSGPPLSFTVAKAPSSMTSNQPSTGTTTVGGTIFYEVLVSGVGGGAPPTGAVTFTMGNLPPQVVQLRPQIGGSFESGSGVSYAAVYFTSLAAGTSTIQASYPGDQNWAASTFTGEKVTVAGASAGLPSFTSATLTSSAGSGPIEPSTVLTLNITVSGGKEATAPPTGFYLVLDEGSALIAFGFLTPSASGATSTATLTFRAFQLYGGTNQLLVAYGGDSNYRLSYAPLVSYTDNARDFTLASTTQSVALRPHQPGIAFLELQGLNGFNGAVDLNCKVTGGPAGNTNMPSCIVPPAAFIQSVQPSASIVLVNTASFNGRQAGVPPGTYNAVITGTTGAATHNVSVTVVVQDSGEPEQPGGLF